MTTGPLPRIVAVVVTFNRLGLLETLVQRLGEIDGLAEVLVIDNASSDGTGEWLAAHRHTGEIPLGSRTLDHQPRRRRRLPRRAGLGPRPRGRPGLADGRRRPARPRLPRAAARRDRQPRLLGPARRGRGRPVAPGVPDPAARRHPRGAPGRRRTPRRSRRPHRRHRDPLQRRPRHQGAGRPDRAARARSSSSGATTTSTGCAPRRRARASRPSSPPPCATPAWATSAPR